MAYFSIYFFQHYLLIGWIRELNVKLKPIFLLATYLQVVIEQRFKNFFYVHSVK